MKGRSAEKKRPEATTRGVLLKKMSLKVSRNSNTCNRVFFKIKLQAAATCFLL